MLSGKILIGRGLDQRRKEVSKRSKKSLRRMEIMGTGDEFLDILELEVEKEFII